MALSPCRRCEEEEDEMKVGDEERAELGAAGGSDLRVRHLKPLEIGKVEGEGAPCNNCKDPTL